MPAPTTAPPQSPRWSWLALAGAILAAAAVLARIQVFGNPVVHIDEQFYLLVGDRMLHGALPYVDIWDRKPVGLFLIYAAIRLLGGDGVLQYQVVATLFAWATAMIVAVMGSRIASPRAGIWAGALYLLALDIGSGQGGQAPVFYNLLVAAAGAIVGSSLLATGPIRLRLRGVVAMLLIGLAMQIKYTVVFEGMAFGLGLLWASWRRDRSLGRLVVDATLFVAAAVLPTAAAVLAYAWLGHLDDFVFANFVSIFHRGVEPPHMLAGRLAKMAMIVAPMAYGLFVSIWQGVPAPDEGRRRGRRLAYAWLGSAVLGVVVFGGYYIHYVLALMPPATVALAPLMVGRRPGRIFGWILFGGSLIASQVIVHNARAGHGDASTLAQAARAMSGGRNCPYVYDGYPAIYYVLRSCLPTTRAFPAHQQQDTEAMATGVDQVQAVAAIMARRPDRVMTGEPAYGGENPRARAALYDVLRRDYRPTLRLATGNRHIVVYALDPHLEALPNSATPGYGAPAVR